MNGLFSRPMWIILVVELVVGGGAIAWRLSSPAVPMVNLNRLPAMTAADIQRLQKRAASDQPAAWQELGEAYLAYGYFPAAEACLRRSARLTPQSFAAVYAHAYSLDRLCRLPEAAAEFQAAARLTNGNYAGNCWYHIGVSHLRRDNVEQAELALARASEFSAPASLVRARLLIRAGKCEEALTLLENVRREFPADIETEMLSVKACRALDRPVDMILAAERAERAELKIRFSDHWEYLHPIRSRYGMMAQLGRSRELMERGDLRQAAELYQTIIDGDDLDHTDGMFEQGVRLLLLSGRPQDADRILSRYQQRMALSPGARHLRGDILAELGRIEEAETVWKDAVSLRSDEQIYESLASISDRRGNVKDAERNRGFAALFRGIDAYRANQLESARQDLDRAEKLLPDDPRPLLSLGEVFLAQGHQENAREAYSRCLAIDPNCGKAADRLEQLRP